MLTKFETKSARVKGKISLAAGTTGANFSKSITKCFEFLEFDIFSLTLLLFK